MAALTRSCTPALTCHCQQRDDSIEDMANLHEHFAVPTLDMKRSAILGHIHETEHMFKTRAVSALCATPSVAGAQSQGHNMLPGLLCSQRTKSKLDESTATTRTAGSVHPQTRLVALDRNCHVC